MVQSSETCLSGHGEGEGQGTFLALYELLGGEI